MLARQRQLCIRTFSVATRCGGRRMLITAAPIHPSQKESAAMPEEVRTMKTASADIHAAGLAAQGRSYLFTSARDDFVKDYKELAKMNVWEDLLDHASGPIRVLDACAGTGRWAQAFSELVVKDRDVSVDFTDLCSDSIGVLGRRQEALGNLRNGKRFTGDLCELGELGVPSLTYDVISNMHGLYGISKAKLPSALQAMHDALKPGGTMVIAIGTQSSPYQRIPTECFGISFTNDTDISQALSGLGIQSSTTYITYQEEFAASDKVGVERFLMDECGGNTFPTEVAEQMMKPEAAIQKYAEAHFDQPSQRYRFKQQVAVIIVRRDAALLPEMQSLGPFYSEASRQTTVHQTTTFSR